MTAFNASRRGALAYGGAAVFLASTGGALRGVRPGGPAAAGRRRLCAVAAVERSRD